MSFFQRNAVESETPLMRRACAGHAGCELPLTRGPTCNALHAGPLGRDPELMTRVVYETRIAMRRMSPVKERLEEEGGAARRRCSTESRAGGCAQAERIRRRLRPLGALKEARGTTDIRSSPNVPPHRDQFGR